MFYEYKYMKTSKIDTQGSIEITSGNAGVMTIDLTGTYDIDDMKTLIGTFLTINVIENNEGSERGLMNGIYDPVYLDTTQVVFKVDTASPNYTHFNNLLKLLGFSDGSMVYTTDQTFTEVSSSGMVISPYMGGKIPLEFIVPLGKGLRCGYSSYTPLTIKRAGEDYVSSVGEYSHSYRVRRGYTLIFRGNMVFINSIDVIKRIFATPVKWYFPAGFHIPVTDGLILLPHTGSPDISIVYTTIEVYSTEISFIKEA
jgi:hypothetical protein